jgi:hypothetical protein
MIRALLIAAALLILPAYPQAEGPRSASETPGTHTELIIAEASCTSLCQQRHNQCRISTRGAARCDADLQRCLKGCIATKKR